MREIYETPNELADRIEQLEAELAAQRDRLASAGVVRVKLTGDIAARDAVIAEMRRIVFDPASDYYGEIRAQFDSLAQSPTTALDAVKAEARNAALEEAAKVAESNTFDRDWYVPRFREGYKMARALRTIPTEGNN